MKKIINQWALESFEVWLLQKIPKSTEKLTHSCALSLNLWNFLFSCTGRLYPYLEYTTNLRYRPPDVKGIGIDFQKVPFFGIFEKIETNKKLLYYYLYDCTFINIKTFIVINNYFTKKNAFWPFLCSKIGEIWKKRKFWNGFFGMKGLNLAKTLVRLNFQKGLKITKME